MYFSVIGFGRSIADNLLPNENNGTNGIEHLTILCSSRKLSLGLFKNSGW